MLDEINLHDAPVPVEFNDEELDTETAIIFWTSGTTGKVTQGGSTITMQVARNFYLTREKKIIRKLREILLYRF